MIYMKKIIFIICFVFVSMDSMCQNQVIEIEFCEKLLSKNKILQMNLLYNGDTLPFPKIGSNKFLSPVYFYNLDSTDFVYTEKDTVYKFVSILLESCKYNYEFSVISTFVLPGLNRFCITGKRRKNLSEFNYGEGSLDIADWAKRKKK